MLSFLSLRNLAGIAIFLTLAAAFCVELANPSRVGTDADEASLDRALAADASVDFRDVPLADALRALGEKQQVRLVLDSRALEDAGIDPVTPVTRNMQQVSLRSILRRLLAPFDLVVVPRNEVLLVTTPDVAMANQIVKAYPILDLLRATDGEGQLVEDSETLERVIHEVIGPIGWRDDTAPSLARDTLIVSQTPDVHAKVARLLSELRRLPLLDSVGLRENLAAWPTLRQQTGEDESTVRSERISLALRRRCTAFPEPALSFADAVAELKRQHAIEIQLDEMKLSATSLAPDVPVDCDVAGMTLQAALNHLLRNSGASWVVDEDYLLITSHDDAAEHMHIAVYPVYDLLDLPDSPTYDEIDAALLEFARRITDSVSGETWDRNGGSGELEAFPARGALVCKQSAEVHAAVRDFFAQVYQSRAAAPYAPSPRLRHTEMVTVIYHLGELPPDANADLDANPNFARSRPLVDPWVELRTPRRVVPVILVADQTQRDRPAPCTPFELAELIKKLVAPESWHNNRPATIQVLPNRIVVHHREAIHRRIRTLLYDLHLYAPVDQAPDIMRGGGACGF